VHKKKKDYVPVLFSEVEKKKDHVPVLLSEVEYGVTAHKILN
jgi:hypothetical protein